MSKKFLSGLALGSLAGLAAWSSLDAKQQKRLKANVRTYIDKNLDVVTDYALDALDAADSMMQDYGQVAADKVSDWSNKLKQQQHHFADHFVSDDFDAKTAEIRDALQNAQDDESDDIIIDHTKDDLNHQDDVDD